MRNLDSGGDTSIFPLECVFTKNVFAHWQAGTFIFKAVMKKLEKKIPNPRYSSTPAALRHNLLHSEQLHTLNLLLLLWGLASQLPSVWQILPHTAQQNKVGSWGTGWRFHIYFCVCVCEYKNNNAFPYDTSWHFLINANSPALPLPEATWWKECCELWMWGVSHPDPLVTQVNALPCCKPQAFSVSILEPLLWAGSGVPGPLIIACSTLCWCAHQAPFIKEWSSAGTGHQFAPQSTVG